MHPGQFIAFIGESGSGKSTITQLLERFVFIHLRKKLPLLILSCRFYDVDSGAVYISGRPVSSISTDSLRSNFSMVSQYVNQPLIIGSLTNPHQGAHIIPRYIFFTHYSPS